MLQISNRVSTSQVLTVEKKSSSKKWLARLACTLQLLAKRTKSKTKRTTTTTTSCNLAKSLLLFHAHTTHPKKLIKKATKQHSSFQRLYKQRCRSLLKMAKRDTTTKWGSHFTFNTTEERIRPETEILNYSLVFPSLPKNIAPIKSKASFCW